jgi:hypothetical protein
MSVRQVELLENDDRLLQAESQRTGLSVSELVHQAVQRCYGAPPAAEPAAKPRLTWDEYFALGGVRANSAIRDEWDFDPLFDDDSVLDEESEAGEPES